MHRTAGLSLAGLALAGGLALSGTALAASGHTAGSTHPAAMTMSDTAPTAVDHAHDRFQPGYLNGRTVVYQPGAPVAGAPTVKLYQVRYPQGWEALTARPQCDYCDHAGNGPDDADFHDHVLTRPDPRANAAGAVTWHVYDVVPAYTGDPAHDASVSAAYAKRLPVQSAREVRALLRARLADGSSVARIVDTTVEFGGPITSRY